ncbi:MAG: type II CAAX endopeptidase family protein [Pseudomonadota bacterium]
MNGAAPLLHSTWLLIRLRLRRLANQTTALRQQSAFSGKVRTGNPGKKSSKVVFYLVWPLMVFGFGSLMHTALVNLHGALDPPDSFWRTVEFSPALTVGAAFLLGVLWFASLLMTIGGGELAKSDWDLEWLVTLPIRAETLLWARILERSIVNPSGFLTMFPVCTIIAWYSEFRWSAPLVGLVAAWPLLLLAALGRTLLDTGLRLSMRASQLRNLNAAISVLSIVVLYLAISFGLPEKSGFMTGLAAATPAWFAWTPLGLTVRALNDRDTAGMALAALGLLAQVAIILWLGVRLLRHQLRHGVVAGGARDAARTAAPAISPTARSRPALTKMSAVQRRELTLLGRDRNFLVQSLVVPLLIVGGQLLLGRSGIATDMWHNPNVLASVAFGLAAYSLSMSAFQTLNNEGHALWLLYTFPVSIEDVLKDKAKLWGVITLAYPTVLFAIGVCVAPVLDWKFLAAMLTAYLGIPIYAFIAVALGVYGSNPLEQQQNQKVKPAYVYLFMTLSALYIYAIVTPDPYQRLVFMLLTLLLSFALWQKARDQLPYLLDPDASPPARVATADGLIAAMLFFVIQAIAVAVMARGGRVTGARVLIAFTLAGGLTYALMRSVYAKAKTQDVPRIVGEHGGQPLIGMAAGIGAALFGVAYMLALKWSGALETAMRENEYVSFGLWMLPLALLAAPVFEEFIFRGLIFGGLRRSFGFWPAALAGAGIFAIIHPPISVLPVFVLGLATAYSYERTRGLLAPMLAHAVYNLSVIAAQAFLL